VDARGGGRVAKAEGDAEAQRPQLATERLGKSAGFLSRDELEAVDRAVALVLDV